jgi:hypothetical protein
LGVEIKWNLKRKINIMKPYEYYKASYPELTDAQIIERLSAELSDKVSTVQEYFRAITQLEKEKEQLMVAAKNVIYMATATDRGYLVASREYNEIIYTYNKIKSPNEKV